MTKKNGTDFPIKVEHDEFQAIFKELVNRKIIAQVFEPSDNEFIFMLTQRGTKFYHAGLLLAGKKHLIMDEVQFDSGIFYRKEFNEMFVKTGASEFKATQKCLKWLYVIYKTLGRNEFASSGDKIAMGLLKASKIMGKIADTTEKISNQMGKLDNTKRPDNPSKNTKSSSHSKDNYDSHKKSQKDQNDFPDLSKFPKKNRRNWFEI